MGECAARGLRRSSCIGFHAPPTPSSHTRALARAECGLTDADDLAPLVLELALACLECAELGRAVMLLQEAADESEARAIEALETANEHIESMGAIGGALEALSELARLEAAECAAAGRWAAHVSEARELARRAIEVTVERGRRRPDWPELGR